MMERELKRLANAYAEARDAYRNAADAVVYSAVGSEIIISIDVKQGVAILSICAKDYVPIGLDLVLKLKPIHEVFLLWLDGQCEIAEVHAAIDEVFPKPEPGECICREEVTP